MINRSKNLEFIKTNFKPDTYWKVSSSNPFTPDNSDQYVIEVNSVGEGQCTQYFDQFLYYIYVTGEMAAVNHPQCTSTGLYIWSTLTYKFTQLTKAQFSILYNLAATSN